MTQLIVLMPLVLAEPELVTAGDGCAAAAIEQFERPWTPEPRTLSGLTVAVTRVGANPPGDRIGQDLVELTCGYIEQLAQRAGAEIVATNGNGKQPDIELGICFGSGHEDDVPAMEAACTPSSHVLADSLRPHLKLQHSEQTAGSEAQTPPEKTREPATCSVGLSYDAANAATEESLRRYARDRATQIVRGLIDYSRRLPPSPVPYRDDDSAKLSRLARSIWPEGNLPAEKVEWFCRMFSRVAITNRSLVYFKPSVTIEGDAITIGGATSVPAIADGLVAALREVGVANVTAKMRSLPDDERLGGKRFGVCIAPHVVTRGKPSPNAVEQTELLYAEPAYLLDREAGYYLLLAGDGYWGWAPESAIAPLSAEAFDAYDSHDRAVVLRDIETERVTVPRGARVAIAASEHAKGKVAMILPDGERIDVDREAVRPISQEQRLDAENRIASALDLLYVPYKFGGRSPLGLDCSGLVGMACSKTGAAPARDAWQLAFAGSLSATSWHRSGLRAGDIVFFINSTGKVYHTGIAISPTHIADSCPPAVQIGSIRPGDRLYDERMDRDFFIAKRP